MSWVSHHPTERKQFIRFRSEVIAHYFIRRHVKLLLLPAIEGFWVSVCMRVIQWNVLCSSHRNGRNRGKDGCKDRKKSVEDWRWGIKPFHCEILRPLVAIYEIQQFVDCDLLERVEVELIDVRFRRIVARRPEVFVEESRCFADAWRCAGHVASCRWRGVWIGGTHGNVSRLIDRVSRVVPGPLVERLATQCRCDDSSHRTERLERIDFVSSGHSTVYCCISLDGLEQVVDAK